MTSGLEEYLKLNWRDISPSESKPDRIRLMKLGGQASESASINLILFNTNKKEPEYFLKMNRKPNEPFLIKQEFDNLRRMTGILQGQIANTFPRPIFLGKMDRNTTVMVETFLPGKKISLNYSELEELYAKSFEWLKIFFKATKKDTIKFSTLKSNSNSENTIAELGLQNELIGKLKTIFEKSRKFENTILPFSASQGDFDFDNIFLNEDSINIADWEDYKEKGEIFIDVDFFVFNTALYFYQTKNHIESFKKFFSSDSQTYKLADYYIADYCKFLGVDKKLFYIVSIFNTIDILKNGYRRHPRVPMQNADFLHALADLTIREITHEQ